MVQKCTKTHQRAPINPELFDSVTLVIKRRGLTETKERKEEMEVKEKGRKGMKGEGVYRSIFHVAKFLNTPPTLRRLRRSSSKITSDELAN